MSIEEFVETMCVHLDNFMDEVNEDIENSEQENSEDAWFERWCSFIDDANES